MTTGVDSILPPVEASPAKVRAFVERWRVSEASEMQNTQLFLSELCDLLEVPRPDPATGDPSRDAYCFERPVRLATDERRTVGRMDLYKAGAFVLEAKQGSDKGRRLGTAKRGSPAWAIAMSDAYGQALSYASQLERPPPFLVVCDVGYAFDLYATFDGSTSYRAYPDPPSHRFFLTDLAERPGMLARLRALFVDPRSLDPATRQAMVTRDIAEKLAELARGLEESGHAPELVARFLMRCIFAMFAEDVGLFPDRRRLFQEFLEKFWVPSPRSFAPGAESFFRTMNTGGTLFTGDTILRFNGGLFADAQALELTEAQLKVLLAAAKKDWSAVEPAIFGTLLERALNAKERHALGAHYTPRAYVERLVRPTLEEPLRREWLVVRAEASQLVQAGKVDAAIEALDGFHHRLCKIRVLDPACGSGNFLYVALDLMKQLEAEVLEQMRQLGAGNERLDLAGVSVSPAQFLGIEKKPWAKEIAELVLWIGHLRWHHRVKGRAAPPPDPVLQNYGNIECRDAVLAWDGEPVVGYRVDAAGRIATRNVEGRELPIEEYPGARGAPWPAADFIIGNPPFIGTRRMRLLLGDDYVDALLAANPEVPEVSDYVMYWWHRAATLVRNGQAVAFGLITTNSITQSFNRAVVAKALDATPPLSIAMAVPDHPWVDSENGAAVRIAMTVGVGGTAEGVVARVFSESEAADGSRDVVLCEPRRGRVNSDLSAGVTTASAALLQSNGRIAYWGVKFYGDGFKVTLEEAERLASHGDGSIARPFVSGRDLTATPRHLLAIDCDGLDEQTLATRYPGFYQWLLERVKPERANNRREFKRERWWIFGENQPGMRAAVRDLPRFIATTETAKHRFFVFIPKETVAEGTVCVIGSSDAFCLGVLSSRVHVTWALAAGGRLGVGNDPRYNKTLCFDPFPFPDANDAQKARIRDLAERLDAHRKRELAAHEKLTITAMYNVLEKLRSGEVLTDKERVVHEQGLVTVLKQLHDELDVAVLDAYGWPHDLTDEQLLEHLVALNRERAAEEASGHVRWLRPDFQAPQAAKPAAVQQTLGTEGDDEDETPVVAIASKSKKAAWPETFFARASALRDLVLGGERDEWTATEVARSFTRARVQDVEAILESFAALGQLMALSDEGERRYRRVLRNAA